MNSYDQKAIEKKWQNAWQKMDFYHFDFDSEKPVYSIDVPPRYASGPLHAGHAVHYTHIDFAARYKRMRGYNVFFPLCFDVNGIPIEERVERELNITRKDIDRHEFIKICSDFAEKNIKTMTEQFIRLGESMDPTIYYQTNAEYYRRITQISFIELYNKGYIYKGEFPVNWCPRCMTAMADAEVTYAQRTTKLNTVKFYFTSDQPKQILKYHGIGKDEKGVYVEIATTRPEMLPVCQIVAVHPSDERSPWLVDQVLRVPLFNKEVKIVEDEAVDPSFGTGVVMICTIGDKEDLNWVFKYKLPLEMCIDEEGRMTAVCGKYKGMMIEEARKAVIEDLRKNNLLIKQEPLEQNVGVCWRCKTPVEFINAEQWFLKTIPFKEKVLEASNKMRWYPGFMKIRLEDWVNSLEWDWVISRQRYFATPIPLWECKDCNHVVVARVEDCYVDPTVDPPPVEKCPKCGGKLKGCEDVFDTWMDSSISPLYNTFWYRDDEKFKKLYPMSLRPQAHDIIRTWAFYTILRCTLLTDKEPFENIMMGGFILSEDGTPMHASLGNVIDPLEVIDEFGTDAFRCYAASCALGEDNPFRRKDVIRGTRLLRKLWNVERFIAQFLPDYVPGKPTSLRTMDRWILSRYSRVVQRCTEYMDRFEFSLALKEVEYFLWHEFADHYIEMAKSFVYEKKNVESILYTLYTIGLGLTKMFAPFFPHITEEIYHRYYKEKVKTESIHSTGWPTVEIIDEDAEQIGEHIKKIIAGIRKWKSEQGLALNTPLQKVEIFTKKLGLVEQGRDDIVVTMNIKDLVVSSRFSEIKEEVVDVKPVYAVIGKKYREKTTEVVEMIKQLDPKKLYTTVKEQGSFVLSDDVVLTQDDVSFDVSYSLHGKKVDVIAVDDTIITIFKGEG
ncbi:MAG TPA: valine--tRNA ligase [Thermoplasmatales archaeon]|nr:valine--tRNA ligase [Thermoplasmatales archaeon]